MRRLMCAAALSMVAVLGIVATGTSAQAWNGEKTPVGRDQYRILLNQCRYADSARLRSECRAAVRNTYRIGRENPNLDCRTYSGVTVCGELMLSKRQAACVQHSVGEGLSPRRSEVECYAFH
ncbi:hypothetical protein [Streptosporangium sp. NPDC087985]|uniref:hypothetical protein n=1 Tax=Streptosporangium sp. NPDC087985 TaxID=3366196 RepID=UPI00382935BA